MAESEAAGGACPIHKGPTIACPKDCSFAHGKDGASVEQNGEAEAKRLESLVSEAGGAYRDLSGTLIKSNPTLETPKRGQGGDLAIEFSRDKGSTMVKLVAQRSDGVSFTVHVETRPTQHGSAIGASAASTVEAVIYLNTAGTARLKQIGREYVHDIAPDGVHIGNHEETVWSNNMLDLSNKVESNDRVIKLMKARNLKDHHFGGHPMRSVAELKELWEAAYADASFLFKKKFPTDLDPGPRPPDTIIPLKDVLPLLETAVMAMKQGRTMAEQAS